MTSKIQTLIYAIGAGVTGYIAYFVGLPQNLQTGILGDITQTLPASWQPLVAGSTKTISVFLGIYASYKASHSGPQTPPANPPTQ